VTTVYSRRSDGRIAVTNSCRETDGQVRQASGVARRVAGQPPSVLQVRFAPAFLSFLSAVWGDYRIIAVGPQYDYAVVGSEDRAYLWFLSRQPQLSPSLFETLSGLAKEQGFDTSALIKTRHTGT
jgi:apolipoprotein D and lipocalin family protein